MRKTAIAVVLATTALLSVWTAQASACRGARHQPSQLTDDAARQAVTCLINQRRSHRGLKRVRGSYALGAAAQEHSNTMASHNFFAHDGDDGTPVDRAQAAGYMAGARVWGVGENLEWGTGKGASPRAIVDRWMRSPMHRAVMLSRRFRQVGVGVTHGSPMSPDAQNAAMYTALFGFRKG
jgi:uncharacterized protein YkwD